MIFFLELIKFKKIQTININIYGSIVSVELYTIHFTSFSQYLPILFICTFMNKQKSANE